MAPILVAFITPFLAEFDVDLGSRTTTFQRRKFRIQVPEAVTPFMTLATVAVRHD